MELLGPCPGIYLKGLEGGHEDRLSEYSMFRPMFEPSTSQIRVKNGTIATACSVPQSLQCYYRELLLRQCGTSTRCAYGTVRRHNPRSHLPSIFICSRV